MLSLFKKRPKESPFASYDALTAYCDRQSAFVSQRVLYEYVRARSGINWSKLMTEKAFVRELSDARWPAYGAVLDDLLLLLEGRLRPSLPAERPAFIAAVMELRGDVRARYSELGGEPPEQAATCLRRLEAAQLEPPQAAEAIARTAGQRLYDALPLAQEVVKYDRQLVTNAVRFLFARLASDLEEQLEPMSARQVLMTKKP